MLQDSNLAVEAASLERFVLYEAPAEQTRVGSDVVSIRYDASDQRYRLTLPTYGEGRLDARSGNGTRSPNGTQWASLESVTYDHVTATGTSDIVLYIDNVGPTNTTTDYRYTAIGRWISSPLGARVIRNGGIFVYGQSTTADSMPRSGTATYLGDVSGYSSKSELVFGNVVMQFDFGAGSLSGFAKLEIGDAWMPDPLGVFNFRDTVYSSGSPTFSGRLAVPDSDKLGSFAGRFAGPGAPEAMASFRTPFFNLYDGRWDEAVGIWQAKKN